MNVVTGIAVDSEGEVYANQIQISMEEGMGHLPGVEI